MNLRLGALAALFAVAGAVISVRVAYVQLVRDDHYREAARNEHFQQQVVRAPRGAILDRNGYPLATSVDGFDVYINREDWQDPLAALTAAAVIAPLIGRPPADLINEARREPEGLYLAYAGLDFDKGSALHDVPAPGLRLVQTTKRFYPEGDLASTLLGFVGRDHTGLAGIEADFDEELGGVAGTIYFERDSIGNRIAIGGERIGQKPKSGGDVRLTIDRNIQRLVELQLDTSIGANRALGGTIIVMEPKTGAILAMASRPGFKLSQLNLNDADERLFRNRAVTDVYEPGSVLKTLTAAMAVDMGKVTPDSTYFDTGAVFIGPSTIRNWDYQAHGTMTVTQVLERSLNTGAVWLGGLVGTDSFYQYAHDFGLGQATGVGLGGEPDGLVRTSRDPDWTPVDLATNSFGQGIAATPLQVVTAIASLVNGGTLMKPHIVESVEAGGERREFGPEPVRQVVKPETASTVAAMMKRVVEASPGHPAAVKGYHVGGKTGTTTGATLADGAVRNGNVASFVGFAPADDPQIIMLVKLDFIEDRLGGRVSAPVFGQLAPQILAYLGVTPDAPQLVAGAR